MEPTKVFGYLRVSGDSQIDGDGFPRQRKSIEDFAATHNMIVVKYFQEEGVSGSVESMDRPAFQEMLTALLSNGVRTVLVEKLDRIARDVMVQEGTIKDLNRKGLELISVCEPDLCGNDPYRVAMRQMLGVFAELDRKSIVIKLKAARERVKQQKGRCEGRKPYGFYGTEVDNLNKIKALRADGQNYEEIARAMNAEGRKTRANGLWYPATVRRIVLA